MKEKRIPLLGKDGWTRHQGNAAKPQLKGADGVVSPEKLSGNDHAVTPPVSGGEYAFRLRKAASFMVCLGILAGFWAMAQVLPAPRPLSERMPGGALLYLESADFATQLRDWNRSEVKSKWIASKNHEEFLTTRLALKLKEVYGEFSSAAGFEPDLNELETIAGTETALALYDIGRLEFLYISRLPSAQLGQNVLTRVRSGYQTRDAAGQSYFTRQAGDRTAAFAIAGDYVVVSTREALLSSALELIRGSAAARSLSQEPWYQDAVRAVPADVAGPAALRLVMDFATVIKTPYFRSYWIQRNTGELGNYYAFLSQVTRKADALEENRVLLRSVDEQATAHESATTELQRFVPDGVGLFRLWDTSSVDFAMNLIRQKFFAAGPATTITRRYAPGESSDKPVGSVTDLGTRIDEAPKPSLAGALDLEPLKGLFESAGLQAVLHLESSVPMTDPTFVSSDAVVALRAASPWNAAAIQSALTSAVASYQSVGNVGLQWRNVTAGNYTLSQWDGLVPLTIYISGQTLWIARAPSLLGSALNRSTTATPPRTGSYLARYTHGAELSPYLKLMRMLDLSDQARYSSFFSENVGSLASALEVIQSVSVTINDTGLVQRQAVRYELVR
ncbi:MAG TPA: hypothetical protein VE422_10420 [Terriglobia bacterium]|nr:hypothetical protein [Terriglobia bacterium]